MQKANSSNHATLEIYQGSGFWVRSLAVTTLINYFNLTEK